MRMEN